MEKGIGLLARLTGRYDSAFGKPGKSVRSIDAKTAAWLRSGGIARPEKPSRRT